MLQQLRSELLSLSNPKKAKLLSGFFKTGKGEYGEGDLFLGIMVPQSRVLAKKYEKLPLEEVEKLMESPYHEERLVALFILVKQYEQSSHLADSENIKKLYKFYLAHTKAINNWDLVDLTAPRIVGDYLLDKDRKDLLRMVRSKNLWERRIAVLATFQFIAKKKEYGESFRIAEILLPDRHDLIQKAVGWMLREIGKRISEKIEREFLDRYYKEMGRTCLRYAIERFDPGLRHKYLKGEI
ncbi:MAG: DNA alkylation repair protein [Candidatus Levyibacteriota bacterium]